MAQQCHSVRGEASTEHWRPSIRREVKSFRSVDVAIVAEPAPDFFLVRFSYPCCG
jgi:hypothetical protein